MGAPWVNAERLARTLNGHRLPGAHFRPVWFEPTFHKHAGRTCGGCQLHVTDRAIFDAVLAPVAWMREIHAQAPGKFLWRQPPYEYEREKMPIDILAGSTALREQIETDEHIDRIAASWDPALRQFAEVRRPFLMYRVKPAARVVALRGHVLAASLPTPNPADQRRSLSFVESRRSASREGGSRIPRTLWPDMAG